MWLPRVLARGAAGEVAARIGATVLRLAGTGHAMQGGMRLPTRSIFLFFAVISSCGAEPPVDVGTPGAADGTQVVADPLPLDDVPLAPPDGATEPAELPADGISFVGDRFALVTDATGPTRALDVSTRAWIDLPGRVPTRGRSRMGSYPDVGLGTQPGAAEVRAWGSVVAVTNADGFALVDLAAGGVVRAAGAGAADDVTYSPEAGLVVGRRGVEVEVIRLVDGARLVVPTDAGPQVPIDIRGDGVSWRSPAGLVVVDGSTLAARTYPSRAPITGSHVSAAVTAFVSQRGEESPADVEIFVDGARAPLRFASASATGLTVDEASAFVAWQELPDDQGHVHIHVVDSRRGSHVRFAGHEACGAAPEFIKSIGRGVVTTDGSCDLGCPSVRWSQVTLRYDARSGALLSRDVIPGTESYSDLASGAFARWESLGVRAGVAPDALLVMPSQDGALFSGAGGLSRISTNGAVVRFERAEGVERADVVWSADAVLVAARVDGRLRVWDGRRGRALW
jgi:hypothetical protein